MMKNILIILIVLNISIYFASGKLFKANMRARSMISETPLLSLDYYGTCAQFENVAGNMKSYSLNNLGCLPIGTIEDVDITFVCQNVRNKVSKVVFTESNPSVIPSTFPHNGPFLISFIPDTFFNISQGANYIRQPKCFTKPLPCELDKSIVSKCFDQSVRRNNHKKGLFDPLKERIFVKSDSAVAPSTCKDPNALIAPFCCPYVTPVATGICQPEPDHDEHEHDNHHHN